MLRLGFFVLISCLANYTYGQVFWTENFGQDPGACSNQGQLAAGFASANGAWSITDTGVNAAQANVWYVSATEAGFGASGACGDGCIDTPGLTNRTLHISTSILGDLGAAYFETGFNFTNTDKRAESPIINCTGQTAISLSFLYMAAGSATDVCTVTYFDGVAWTNLGVLAPTPNTCAPQGTWTDVSFNLPASADNNANVKLGFRWVNLDDGLATDPSIAIDDITLTGNAVVADVTANYSASQNAICIDDCVSFTDLSTGPGINSWTWTFDGALTASSTDQNPTNICYDTPGSYIVTLLVANDLGEDDELVSLDFIVVADCSAGPVAAFNSSETTICAGDCVDFSDASLASPTDWFWSFPGSDTPLSNDQNPIQVCYDTPGQYNVSLIVSDGTDNDNLTEVNYITVEDCVSPPAVSFEAESTVICVGDCVDFTNLSTGPGQFQWNWTFEGADPLLSFNQNPINVCYVTAGSYDVALQVTGPGGVSELTIPDYITVVDTCGPIADFNFTSIVCRGQCYSFENISVGGTDYFWQFQGATPSTSTDENPQDICYLGPNGAFNVTLTVSNEFGSSTSITYPVLVVNPPAVNAGADQTITQGTSTTLSATGGNGSGTFLWQPYEDVSCFSCPSTQATPTETTEFIVYYQQAGGCQSSDTVTVFVNEVISTGLPNTFSPNGDGSNDILYVRGNNIKQMSLIVYNRYGQQVFESFSQTVGWDGTMNGRDLNPGVFGYYLEVYFTDGTRTINKGDITLVR